MSTVKNISRYVTAFLKWGILSTVLGAIGGILGALFHHGLHAVTHLRAVHPWLLYLLPVGGIVTVGLYRLCGLAEHKGTNEIIDAARAGRPVKFLLTPAIFIATNITHLFGGSAGREGAALQLGGSIASLFARILRYRDDARRILTMSGMSAVFAGLFGTPLTACIFTMEFLTVGTLFSPALFPCFISAFTASLFSRALGVHAETFPLPGFGSVTWSHAWKLVVLAVALSLLGFVMCKLFHEAEHLSKKALPDPWLRIAVGGAVIVGLTMLVGDHRYNGAGMEMALSAVEGQYSPYDFLLKMLFTAITLAAGFKGGEIVPTFCIGATFGALMGSLLGFDVGLSAALGLVGLFCSATNAPIASILLSIELFGSANAVLFALVCVITFLLSGPVSLYSAQTLQFEKTAT